MDSGQAGSSSKERGAMRICSWCKKWLMLDDGNYCSGRCAKLARMAELAAPAVEGPVLRPKSKPRIVRGDD